MKTLTIILAATVALLTPSFAAKKEKPEGAKGKRKELLQSLKSFDKDGNRKIEGDEAKALNEAYATASVLKPLDRNSDGKLDDEEIARLNKRSGKPADGTKKAGKKRKKN